MKILTNIESYLIVLYHRILIRFRKVWWPNQKSNSIQGTTLAFPVFMLSVQTIKKGLKLPSHLHHNVLLTLKKLGGARWAPPPPHPCSFPKNVSSKERVEAWLFLTFNIIITDIFPENFIDIPQIVQKMWRLYLPILAIFLNLHIFFGFFDIFLSQRNWWRQLITDDVGIFSLSTCFKQIVEQLYKVILILD